MLTWSLGWAPSPARLAITSLAFMFDDVPEPVWKTSIGNWSSNSPAATRSAGGRDALGVTGVEQAEFGVDARGGSLDATEPADHRNRDRLAGDREVGDGLGGLAAPELLDAQSCSRSSFRCLRLRRTLPRSGRGGGQARPPPSVIRIRPSGLAVGCPVLGRRARERLGREQVVAVPVGVLVGLRREHRMEAARRFGSPLPLYFGMYGYG